MGIFSDNPVLEREVRGRLRLKRKGAGLLALWTAAPVGLVALYFYGRGLVALGRASVRDAQDLWPFLVYGVLTLLVLLAPALSSTAITQEREQQTWDALAATRLTAPEVLLGKWAGRQLIPALILAVSLPFLIACDVRGQMGVGLFAGTLAFLALTSAAYGALGLLCSFGGRRTAGATATALVATAFLCGGTYVADGVIHLLTGDYNGGSTPVLWLSPFEALAALQAWQFPGAVEGVRFSHNNGGLEGSIVGIYFFVTLLGLAGSLWLMIRRYANAVRG